MIFKTDGLSPDAFRRRPDDRESSPVDEAGYRLAVAELRQHQAELEQQNRELRDTQQALKASRDEYARLYDSAPVGYATLDRVGTVRQINLPCARLLGAERTAILGTPLGRFLAAGERNMLHHYLTQVLTTGIRCSLDVRLSGESDRPSVLRLHGERSQSETEGAVCRVSVMDVTDEKRAEDLLRTSLEEKDVVLREIHHRVKNNLQIVARLLSLQASAIDAEDARTALRESQQRVQLMAQLHEKLYQSQDLNGIEFGVFIEDRVAELGRYYGAGNRIELRTQMDFVRLGIDQAVPCAQIVNELVSNAIRHGFASNLLGVISVSLRRPTRRDVVIEVCDNGVGLAGDRDWRSSPNLGLKLVETLAKQLHGKIERVSGPGTAFKLQFELAR